MNKPKLKHELHFLKLKEAIIRYLNPAVCVHTTDCECKHRIFEAAMEMFFDKEELWKYVREMQK